MNGRFSFQKNKNRKRTLEKRKKEQARGEDAM